MMGASLLRIGMKLASTSGNLHPVAACETKSSVNYPISPRFLDFGLARVPAHESFFIKAYVHIRRCYFSISSGESFSFYFLLGLIS